MNKEPKRIPLNPATPRTHKPKSFPLPALYPETMSDDVYMPDNDSVYRYYIHSDFCVQSDTAEILRYYEDSKKGIET